MTATSATSRVVVVHGETDPGLDAALRAVGLVPGHQAGEAVIWVPAADVPAVASAPSAPVGAPRLLLTVTEAAQALSIGRSTIYSSSLTEAYECARREVHPSPHRCSGRIRRPTTGRDARSLGRRSARRLVLNSRMSAVRVRA